MWATSLYISLLGVCGVGWGGTVYVHAHVCWIITSKLEKWEEEIAPERDPEVLGSSSGSAID